MPIPSLPAAALGLAFLLSASAHGADSVHTAPDTPGGGPYPAIKEQVAALPGYVVYRPRDLARLGPRGLGVYVFGNGACAGDGAAARMHLLEIASHGFVAIAPGGIHSGPGATPRPERVQRNLEADFRPETPVDALDRALDWALAENTREGSALRGKIDPAQVAASGYSCGGLQALHTARDPRVRTVVMMYSGLFPDGASLLAGMAQPKSYLGQLRGSVLYVLGGPEDIAYQNGMDDFARIGHIPAAVVNLPVGHGGTFSQPNGGMGAAVTVDWLKWQLRGDAAAARQFSGPDCGYCQRPGLQLQGKRLN
jgi:hypothetical protein